MYDHRLHTLSSGDALLVLYDLPRGRMHADRDFHVFTSLPSHSPRAWRIVAFHEYLFGKMRKANGKQSRWGGGFRRCHEPPEHEEHSPATLPHRASAEPRLCENSEPMAFIEQHTGHPRLSPPARTTAYQNGSQPRLSIGQVQVPSPSDPFLRDTVFPPSSGDSLRYVCILLNKIIVGYSEIRRDQKGKGKGRQLLLGKRGEREPVSPAPG